MKGRLVMDTGLFPTTMSDEELAEILDRWATTAVDKAVQQAVKMSDEELAEILGKLATLADSRRVKKAT